MDDTLTGVSQKLCKRPWLMFQRKESLSRSWKKTESWAMISGQFLVRIVQRFSALAQSDADALLAALQVDADYQVGGHVLDPAIRTEIRTDVTFAFLSMCRLQLRWLTLCQMWLQIERQALNTGWSSHRTSIMGHAPGSVN